ncbi:MAG TPA: TIM barrel protein [Terriglobia bacterium]|nr:TIM barrel protein [Terriglobia bacterium]
MATAAPLAEDIMKRRDFFARILAGATPFTALFPAPRSTRRHRAASPAGAGKLGRVGISTWSFHNHFDSTADEVVNPAERLVLMDFPEMIADRYKVHNLEFVAPHFASLEPAYLEELKGKLLRAHSRLVNIPVDVPAIQKGGGLSDPFPSARGRAIAAAKTWIDIAKQMGARSVRCDPGKMQPDDLTLTTDSYRTLAAYGRSKAISVLIENHGSIGSEHPEVLIQLFKNVDDPFLGALPDFGNFPDQATRLRGLPLLFPYAKTVCHAKGLNLDASGNETRFDFGKCVEISQRAGYKGVYSIEYEGPGDAYDGVQKVVNELLRYLH